VRRLNKKDLAMTVFWVVAFIAIFHTVSIFFQQLDIATIPEPFKPYVIVVVTFFSSNVVAFFAALTTNVFGYLVHYFRSNLQEEYNPNKMYETIAKYVALFTTIDTIVALFTAYAVDIPELRLIALAIELSFVVALALISVYKQLKEPIIENIQAMPP